MIKIFCDECGFDITGKQNFARRSVWFAKGKYTYEIVVEMSSNISGRHVKSDRHVCDICFNNLMQLKTKEEPEDEAKN